MPAIDEQIASVISTFNLELVKFRSRTGAPANSWNSTYITFQVSLGGHNDELKIELSIDTTAGRVRASNLATLMTEAYRRAGFDETEVGKVQAIASAMIGLPAPANGQDESANQEYPPAPIRLDDEILF